MISRDSKVLVDTTADRWIEKFFRHTKVDLLLLVTILLVIVAFLLGVLESILDVGVVGVNAGEGSEKLLGMRDGGKAGEELRIRDDGTRDQTKE